MKIWSASLWVPLTLFLLVSGMDGPPTPSINIRCPGEGPELDSRAQRLPLQKTISWKQPPFLLSVKGTEQDFSVKVSSLQCCLLYQIIKMKAQRHRKIGHLQSVLLTSKNISSPVHRSNLRGLPDPAQSVAQSGFDSGGK